MFDKYLELGGVEIANGARVKAYVDKNAPHLPFRGTEDLDTLHLALGEAEYESPTVDGAPWLDPSNPATAKFYGVYPLAIQGMDDSTLRADTAELLGEGAVVGAQRFGGRAIRVRALLVAETALALEAGATWLKSALTANSCDDHGGGSCGGAKLCYYAANPEVCDEWEPTFQAGYSMPLSVNVATSPLLIREQNDDSMYVVDLDSPYYPATSSPEGVVIQWGSVLRTNTSVVVEEYGPIVRQRTNRLLNPMFATNLSNWSAVGSATLSRSATGNVVDGPYAHVDVTSGVAGIRGNLAELPGAALISSFGLRAPDGPATLTARMLSATDAVLAEATFDVTADWSRYDLIQTSGLVPTRVEIVGSADFDVARGTVEQGRIPLPPFSGSTPWQEAAAGYIVGGMEDEYTVSWLGTPNASASRLVWNGRLTVGKEFGAATGSGSCDTWPYISIMQGQLAGGAADFGLRMKIATATQVRPYERTMHDVTCIEGPIKIQDLPGQPGMRTVEFTLVAGKPSAYSTTETIIHPTLMSTLPTSEWPGVDDCALTGPEPIFDPDCIVPPSPPRPPTIPGSCVITEPTLFRYWLSVPASSVSLWSDIVPRVTIRSGEQAIRQVRVRAFPNPFNREIGGEGYDLPVDPCSWCSEFIVSYLPPQTELTVDAILERAFASIAGGPSQPADTLMYASDGGPMTWPALTCGISYLFAIDVPEVLLDDVTIAVELARKE